MLFGKLQSNKNVRNDTMNRKKPRETQTGEGGKKKRARERKKKTRNEEERGKKKEER